MARRRGGSSQQVLDARGKEIVRSGTILDIGSARYSDTPKFVPRKLHQAENSVDHLILWHSMDETEREELKEAYRKEKDPRVVARMLAVHMVYTTEYNFVNSRQI